MKVKFDKDYSPRKRGDVVEFITRDEIRTAEWYLANGIASRCKCSEAPNGCPDCEEKAKTVEEVVTKPAKVKVKAKAKKVEE